VAALAIGLVALPGSAFAHSQHLAPGGDAAADPAHAVPVSGPIDPSVVDALGEGVELLSNGLYRVPVPGPDLLTHGPDTSQAVQGGKKKQMSLGPGDPQRSPACSEDQYYQRVLYARSARGPHLDSKKAARIRASIRRADALLNREALIGGGVTADYKVLCDQSGAIRIDEFTVGSGDSFKDLVAAAGRAGFNDQDVDYTIFFDLRKARACGVGSMWPDERPGPENKNNNQPGDGAPAAYALIYEQCWGSHVPMHENAHNQGAVQWRAPGSTGNGLHCWDEEDVLCYAPDGGSVHQEGMETFCATRLHFDCGSDRPALDGDTYFDPVPEPDEWLATHWNLGSRVNRFISFGPSPGGEPNPAEAGADPAEGQTESQPAAEPSPPTARRVRNRAWLRTVAGPGGTWSYYWFNVPRRPHRRSEMRVALSGMDCKTWACRLGLDLYVRKAALPQEDAYNCRPGWVGSEEACRVRRPGKGLWYVAVLNNGDPAGSPYSVSVTYRR
jgi:hypothetical protein